MHMHIRWFHLQGVRTCGLFIWDDLIEGHPPYVRPRQHEPNSSNFNCSNLLTEIVTILKEIQAIKDQKMKLELHNAVNSSKMYKNLLILSWIIMFAYLKMFG
jgi:hypothetical protein